MSSALITLSPIRFREKVHLPTVVCTLVSNCFIIVFCVSLCYRYFAPPPPQVLRCWMKFQRWATQKRAWPKRCKPKMFVNTWPIAPTWKTNRSKCLDWRSTERRGEWKLFANFHLLYPIIYNNKIIIGNRNFVNGLLMCHVANLVLRNGTTFRPVNINEFAIRISSILFFNKTM